MGVGAKLELAVNELEQKFGIDTRAVEEFKEHYYEEYQPPDVFPQEWTGVHYHDGTDPTETDSIKAWCQKWLKENKNVKPEGEEED